MNMNHITQTKLKALAVILILGILGIVSLSGCTTQKENTIKISGAYSLYPMMVVWANEYQKLHPNVSIDVTSGGAGKGMSDALGGTVNLGMVSRDVTPEEAAQGIIAVAVVEDAVLATINSANPVINNITQTGLTKQQLKDIFITRTITTWGQVIGDASNTDPIRVYSRSDVCGAAETWAKYLGEYTQDDFPTVEEVSKVKGDDSMSQAVSGDPLAIGYSNVNYIYSNATHQPKTRLAVVPLDLNENGTLDADENFYQNRDDIVNAELNDIIPAPPSRLVYLVTLNNFTGITKDFVLWILTEGQQYTFANGYGAIPSDILDDQLAIIED
ncbi:MAG: PstS family phosphate ABC transporter substrate-binding protein [Candidatus Thermoplasmatota archaeon]|nr:PstS family phosphate ABC transporter substrate-binding protein [Candidatus Thermoplasmatota archaeon]